MNKWRDSCLRNNDGLKIKSDKIDKDFSSARQKALEKKINDYN
jgi:hypothetical protein